MAKHADDGDEVGVVFLTNGVGSRGSGEEISQDVEHRRAASEKALAIS